VPTVRTCNAHCMDFASTVTTYRAISWVTSIIG
jgi:hypothetical protein